MLLTEDQARTKICPEAMGQESEVYANCRASNCMAWRWLGTRKNDTSMQFTGYCGKAGKPEPSS